jgi:hypothetical protein
MVSVEGRVTDALGGGIIQAMGDRDTHPSPPTGCCSIHLGLYRHMVLGWWPGVGGGGVGWGGGGRGARCIQGVSDHTSSEGG